MLTLVLSKNTCASLHTRGVTKRSAQWQKSSLFCRDCRGFSQITCPCGARCACQVLLLKSSFVYLIMECVLVLCVHLQINFKKKPRWALANFSCIKLVNRYLHCKNVTTNITFLTTVLKCVTECQISLLPPSVNYVCHLGNHSLDHTVWQRKLEFIVICSWLITDQV